MTTTEPTVSGDLLQVLACPRCRSAVAQQGRTIRCTGDACGLVFPIRNGIPIMLLEEARKPGANGSSDEHPS